MTKEWWWKEVIPLDTTSKYELDKLMANMLKRVAKKYAVKKSDIGKEDTKSGAEHCQER